MTTTVEDCKTCDEKKSARPEKPERRARPTPPIQPMVRQNARYLLCAFQFHGLPAPTRWWRALPPRTRFWVGLPVRAFARLCVAVARVMALPPLGLWYAALAIATGTGIREPLARWRERARAANQRYPGCGCTVLGKSAWTWLKQRAVSFTRPVPLPPIPVRKMTEADVFTGTLPERKPKQQTTERPPAPEGTPAPPPASASVWGAQ